MNKKFVRWQQNVLLQCVAEPPDFDGTSPAHSHVQLFFRIMLLSFDTVDR